MSRQLRAAGRRLTPQRQAVLCIVAESKAVLRPALQRTQSMLTDIFPLESDVDAPVSDQGG